MPFRKLGQRWSNLGGFGIGTPYGVANKDIVIPQYFETNNGTLLEGFGDIGDWSIFNGTKVENTTQFITGGKSIKVTTNGTTATVDLYKNVNYGTSAPSRFRIYFYLHDVNFYIIRTELYTGGSNRYRYDILSIVKGLRTPGWNSYDIMPSMWTSVGSPNWANGISKIVISIGANAGGVTTEVSLGAIYDGVTLYPSAFISFDDGLASVYTKAFNYTKTLSNVRCTAYVPGDSISPSGPNISYAQLLEMQSGGWCIGTHGNSIWTGASNPTADNEIANTISELQTVGITEGWEHAAYPTGGYDRYAIDRLINNGILTGRIASADAGEGQTRVVQQNANGYYIGAQQIDAATSLATAKGYVDTAIANNQIAGLFMHDIVDSGAIANQWNLPDFQALIGYIITQEIPFITPIDLYNSISGSITVPSSW